MTSHSPTTSKSFIRRHLKSLFIGATFVILIVTGILLVLFLVVLKPGKTENVTTMASFNLTTISTTKTVSTSTAVYQSTHGQNTPSKSDITSSTVGTQGATTSEVFLSSLVTQPTIETTNFPKMETTTDYNFSTLSSSNSTTSFTTKSVPSTSTFHPTPAIKISSTSRTDIPALNLTTSAPTTASTVICTEGFTLINNKCWMLAKTKDYRANANKLCLSNKGSTLVSIKNSDENNSLAKFVEGKKTAKIWLGLKCEGFDGSTCKWDYGQGPLGAYSNFGSGSPNKTIGECIYYLVSSKQWISHSCSDKNVNIVCELPTTRQGKIYRHTDSGSCTKPAWFMCKRPVGQSC